VLTYGEGRGPAASDLPCGACVGGTAVGGDSCIATCEMGEEREKTGRLL
jgi:hypothetical protein